MHNLSELELKFIDEIRTETFGVPYESAHTIILVTNDPQKNIKIIGKLISRNLLNIVNYNGIAYLQYNSKEEIDNYKEEFTVIGPPHSPNGMDTLTQVFLNNPLTLYLCLGTTSYEHFENLLLKRMKRKYRTVFIYPSYESTTDSKKEHYITEKRKWINFYRSLEKSQKKLLSFRIAAKDFSYLKNSMITNDHVRLNIRTNDSSISSRIGVIIRFEKNNTIYKIVENTYQKLFNCSMPVFLINPGIFVKEFLKRNCIKVSIFLISLLLVLIDSKNLLFQGILSGLLIDIVASAILNININRKMFGEN